MSISFTKLGEFSFIIFSHRFSIVCSLSSHYGTPMMHILVRLKLSQRLLTLPLFFRSSFFAGLPSLFFKLL